MTLREFRETPEYRDEVKRIFECVMELHTEKYKLHHLKIGQRITHFSVLGGISKAFVRNALNGIVIKPLYLDALLSACVQAGIDIKKVYKLLSK